MLVLLARTARVRQRIYKVQLFSLWYISSLAVYNTYKWLHWIVLLASHLYADESWISHRRAGCHQPNSTLDFFLVSKRKKKREESHRVRTSRRNHRGCLFFFCVFFVFMETQCCWSWLFLSYSVDVAPLLHSKEALKCLCLQRFARSSTGRRTPPAAVGEARMTRTQRNKLTVPWRPLPSHPPHCPPTSRSVALSLLLRRKMLKCQLRDLNTDSKGLLRVFLQVSLAGGGGTWRRRSAARRLLLSQLERMLTLQRDVRGEESCQTQGAQWEHFVRETHFCSSVKGE